MTQFHEQRSPFSEEPRITKIKELVFSMKGLGFDVDGVLLDTVEKRNQGFLDLFSDYPAFLPKIDEYNKTQGGVNRSITITHVLKNIIGVAPDETIVNSLSNKFSSTVIEGILNDPKLIPGVKEFLREQSVPLFAATGGPESDAKRLLDVTGLWGYFGKVFMFPTPKDDAIRQAGSFFGLKPSEILYFGDAALDHEAAVAAGVNFVAVTNNPGTFPLGTHHIRDFTQLI